MADTKNAKPITLTIGDKTYTLEFNWNSVSSAERAGLTLQDVMKMETPATTIPLLFFAAFKMHNPEVTRKDTDNILFNEMGGLSQEVLARLVELFIAPYNSLMRDESDEERKNVKISL